MDEEEQVLAVKLALLGIGIWSEKEYYERSGKLLTDREHFFTIVRIDDVYGDGAYYFADPRLTGWFPTRRKAMEVALEAALNGEPCREPW